MRRAALLLFAFLAMSAHVWAVDGYDIDNGDTTQITEFGVCRKVTNGTGGGTGLYVPTKYAWEWINSPTSFVSSVITGVSLASCLDAGSLRFRSAASQELVRTPATTGNQKTYTISAWVKRGDLGAAQTIAGAYYGSSSRWCTFQFDAGDTLTGQCGVYSTGATSLSYTLTSSAVFRDPGAWLHVVLAVDTTQATASDRVKIYVNGQQLTAFGTANYPAQNADGYFNVNTTATRIGHLSSTTYFDGYMAEVYLVDGQALAASSFGQSDPTTNQWVPKAYGGTYGTNGFYLNYADNTNLGLDSSGNGNTFTPTNFSTTAGTTYDPGYDYPGPTSASGNGVGNYPTMNPLAQDSGVTNANRTFVSLISYGTSPMHVSTIGLDDGGKYYAELKPTAISSVTTDRMYVSVVGGPTPLTAASDLMSYLGDGRKSGGAAYGATWTLNDVIGIALDTGAPSVTFYKNGVSQGVIALPFAGPYFFNAYDGPSSAAMTFEANFGQRAWDYTPPVGYLAPNTYNLATPAIVTPTAYFKAVTYTGNGTSQNIDVGFQPDIVWIRSRSAANDSGIYDSVRGAQQEVGASTAAESTQAQGLTAFSSTGFTVGNLAKLNTNGTTYVAWAWKKGSLPGVDVVTYTGTGTTNAIPHSLGVPPSMIMTKTRSGTGAWQVYHSAVGTGKSLQLAATAPTTSANIYSAVSSASWTQLSTTATTNANGSTYVAYAFAEVPGFSKFGTYAGTGNVNGPFIYTGFRPGYLMIKKVTNGSVGNWVLYDTARSPFNQTSNVINVNGTAAEIAPATAGHIDLLSNGFKPRVGSASLINTSGDTYIYAAFAEAPFKYANAR